MQALLKQVKIDQTREGAVSQDLFDQFGVLLLRKGQVITANVKELLRKREVFVWIEQAPKNYANGEIMSFPRDHYIKLVGALWNIFHDAKLIQPEQIEKTVVLVEEILKDLKDRKVGFDFSPIPFDYGRLKEHDYGTFIHSLNVALLAAIIGMRLGYTDRGLKNLVLGALLHDLGKLKVPINILRKYGKLTEHEFDVIKGHPYLGAGMLKNTDLPPSVIAAVKEHHERWNGQGYPHGLQGDSIHLDAIPPYQALEMIIAWSGTDFNPLVVEAFRESLVLYPKNAVVTLNTGETGRVVAINQQFPTRPLIRLLHDNRGKLFAEEVFLDLMENLTQFIERMEFEEEAC